MRLTDYVDPYVGAIGHLLRSTEPLCAYPHGMSQIRPLFTPGIKDLYLADKIVGFSAGGTEIMPEAADGSFASRFDHDLESCRVSGYSAWLEDCGCTVSYAPSLHGGILRFVFDEEGTHRVRILAGTSVEKGPGVLNAVGQYMGAGAFVRLSPSVSKYTARKTKATYTFRKFKRTLNGLILTFRGREIAFAFALSFISPASAEQSFEEEVAGRRVEELDAACADTWEALLSKFEVTGSERNKKIFYTGLYRIFLRQLCISEHGQYYSGFDKQVHPDEGHPFYVCDQVWDTHRGAHPLQALIEPERHADILESFLRQYEQSGWLHDFPYPGGGHACMLGSHTTTLFANALAHGEPFDKQRAWKAVRYTHFEGSLLPWYIGGETDFDRSYREKGYCPALRPGEKETHPHVHPFERRQAVAVTLEQAFDDYSAAKLADAVGADEEAAILRRWAQNYRNLFDPSIKFMAPKDDKGEFIRPYDPKLAHAQGGRDYFAECNGWVYTMEVRHDVAGLIDLFGGKEEFARRMDDIFTVQPDISSFQWLSLFPDSTGLIGQFCMGNEPAFHIPYMYNFCGQPWKTQKILHDICRVWFSPHPLGICGDEDGGAMSAWYVFTAMGFYPFCVGSGVYVIGSPQFDEITLHLGNGRDFTVLAKGAAEGKKYIRAARLNGRDWDHSWFTADDLLAGGVLELQMSERPCKTWAAADDQVPPSLY